MLHLDGFFKYQRGFYGNESAQSGAARQPLQPQTFLSQTFAECNFWERRERLQVAYAPTVESFEETVGGFFLIIEALFTDYRAFRRR